MIMTYIRMEDVPSLPGLLGHIIHGLAERAVHEEGVQREHHGEDEVGGHDEHDV